MEQVDENQQDERQSAPKRCETLVGEPGPSLDRIARLAAHIVETPMSAIVCREDGEIVFKSAIGLDSTLHAGNSSLFSHSIESGELLAIEDASADRRFEDDPLVTSPPHLRFFISVPLFAPDGQPIGALSIADTEQRPGLSDRDLTTLRAVADLVAHGEQTAPSQGTGSTVLIAMSHDLRTPMNGVLGMAELLLATDELDERHRRRVEIIKRSGTTLLSLLDQILDLAKLDKDAPETAATPFDLRDLVDRAAFNDFGKGLQLDIVDHLDICHNFLGDATRVQKLLSCFLDNAARFTAEGTIRLTASAEAAAKDRMRIQIRAESASIDPEKIEHVLASISTSADPNAGHFDEAALGLTLCRKLALMMGGTIGVDRPPSDNAPAFWLDLSLPPDPEVFATSPVSAEAVISDSAISAPAIPDPGESRNTPAHAAWHVLIAEDNPDMAMLIEDFLDEAGYQATIAYDGASTLKILGEKHFDVVLMDGRMPDMSGFETTAFIRQLPDERADIPIIALTGEAMAGDRERFLSAGMNDYIAKPVDYDTLIDTIERCCSQRQLERSSNIDTVQTV